ncbi:MAG: FKBP-type peptidyl-prolyl cis-trans isomerase [Candidatus Latescibacteria bacterium]|nr:FKBP-type peptidyl-prolyl cis-trans isomerase [Candidatus Latescibacterota bacterium]
MRLTNVRFTLPPIFAFLLVLVGCSGSDKSAPEVKTEDERISYAIGFSIGSQLKMNIAEDTVKIDPDVIALAIADVMENNDAALSPEEIQKVLDDFQAGQKAAQQRAADENKIASSEFLAQNAGKDNVVTLEDSLQYEIIEEGSGATPMQDDTVRVNYHGTLIDGTVFDSSVDRGEPVQFPVRGVIPGWTQVLQMMKVGGKWKVYIPPELGYGLRGSASIPPNSLLIFEIELLDIVDNKTQPK